MRRYRSDLDAQLTEATLFALEQDRARQAQIWQPTLQNDPNAPLGSL
jgi:hypothetical protein